MYFSNKKYNFFNTINKKVLPCCILISIIPSLLYIPLVASAQPFLPETDPEAQAEIDLLLQQNSQPTRFNFFDADNDGVDDQIDPDGGTGQIRDLDRDGISDYIDRDGGSNLGPRDETPSNLRFNEGINPLYPAKNQPNEISFEGLGIDTASCIGALMATRLAQTALASAQETSERLANSAWIGEMWSFFLGGSAAGASAGSQLNTSGPTEQKTKEAGFDIAGIPIAPSMDGLAFCAKHITIAYLQASIIKWANEAFDGAAAYVDDLEATINDVANLAFTQTIGEVNICAHLRGSVDLSLLSDLLRSKTKTQGIGKCTVTYDREFQAVLDGNLFNYNDFDNIYSNPMNNTLGAYLETYSRNQTLRNTYEENLKTELGWSKGWWPWKDENGRTLTPGAVIEDKILSILRIDTDNLVIADEVDELLFTIFNQLIKVNLQDTLSRN
jgi:hypothetical protein